MASETELNALIERALEAARDAAKAHDATNPGWYPCGFAWVNIKPARGKLITLLKNMKIGRTDAYYGGYSIWNPSGHNSQHMYTLEAGAKAFAKVLNDAGFKVSVCTRMD